VFLRVLIRAVVAGLVLVGAGALVPAHAQDTGDIFLLNAIPDRTIDLFVNDRMVGDNVGPTSIVGAVPLAGGTYRVRAAAEDGRTLLERDLAVTSGQSVDAVLHLDSQASPQPVVTLFPNDLTPVPADQLRVAIAHTASVPPADIRVDGQVLFANVANGEGLTTVVPAGTYQVDIVPTGTSGPAVLGPAPFELEPGTLTRVFAIGRPPVQSMQAIVQTFPLTTTQGASPRRVESGSGGAAAEPSLPPMVFGGLVVLAVGVGAFLRRTART
jgi:hypothetical protein